MVQPVIAMLNIMVAQRSVIDPPAGLRDQGPGILDGGVNERVGFNTIRVLTGGFCFVITEEVHSSTLASQGPAAKASGEIGGRAGLYGPSRSQSFRRGLEEPALLGVSPALKIGTGNDVT